nr:hypothetical protein [Tanacetum cinerariifolium]
MALSREELCFSNISKMANVSKSISIPNEDLSDDTTPSVACKFLNEVKSAIVTLQRVVKQRMNIETYNWASSAHQEFHKIVREEIFPIVNQVDARVQNFEIQFLKEAAKFVGDFKSLAKEADASLAKHKILELEIERLLKAVVSQDIISVMQKASVVDTSDLQTELERMKECFENCIIKKKTEYAKLWNDWYKKCDECKYDKISYDKAKTANVSKSISIPNEDLSDDTTPSVARKFLNEEADASLAKHKILELEIERLLKAVVSQDIISVVQNASVVDTSDLQNELQRTKERFENSKFVGDFKYLAKEADASLAKHNILVLEIERLLKAVVSQDIIFVVQNASVVDTSYLQTELEPYKDMQQKIKQLQAQLGVLKGKSKDTSCVSATQNQLSQKLENANVKLEFQVFNYARENAHLKTTYK